jgi:Glycosyltransferases involved in cell wall biogenesis
MKLLTFAVPCYNSESYMERCIQSLLPGGEDVEILIINDGSQDRTGVIADTYADKYPEIIKAIHQDNGGHGEAVNTGLYHANGLFFKVVDSDDWLSTEAYVKVLETLRQFIFQQETLDMLICNYIYDKKGVKHKKVINYQSAFPTDKIFGWKNVNHFRKGRYLLMHSIIYRTQILRNCGLHLPGHTFYVDNIYAFNPLPEVKTMYYLNINFYHYFIGRADQSVNEQVMISRIDQQIFVTKQIINKMTMLLNDTLPIKLEEYMLSYVEIMMTVSSVLLMKSGTEDHFMKKEELWSYLYMKSPEAYHKIRNGILGKTMNLPGKSGRRIALTAYQIANMAIGFS